MPFQPISNQINWKVHFQSSIDVVFDAISTDEGRARFWAESAIEKDGIIEFNILNYPLYQSKILNVEPPHLFQLEYFGTEVTFDLVATEDGGTDLSLSAKLRNESAKNEMTAGWVSVLLAMKAAVDFDVDLRNHNTDRVWDKGFVDN